MKFSELLKNRKDNEIAKEVITRAIVYCHTNNNLIRFLNNQIDDPIMPVLSSKERKEGMISAMERIVFREVSTPQEMHKIWEDFMKNDGWSYAKEKSHTNKTHPCMVPYDELPEFEKLKDQIFIDSVLSFEERFDKINGFEV